MLCGPVGGRYEGRRRQGTGFSQVLSERRRGLCSECRRARSDSPHRCRTSPKWSPRRQSCDQKGDELSGRQHPEGWGRLPEDARQLHDMSGDNGFQGDEFKREIRQGSSERH